MKDGVEGAGGYISAKPYTAIVQAPPYRQALTFLGKGALLSLGGDLEDTIVERFTATRDYRGLFLLHIRVAPPERGAQENADGGEGRRIPTSPSCRCGHRDAT